MASSADRMAAGAGFGALAKADELKKRLWFTVGALIIYRLGTYLPLPGIDPDALLTFSLSNLVAFWACSTCSRVARLAG